MIIIKTAVCVCSGGIDSTIAATIASCEGYELHLFHASYGQRAEEREKEAGVEDPTVYINKPRGTPKS
jgi:7-cyano-7-deazaguanine synthase in queuosine biosynthesis